MILINFKPQIHISKIETLVILITLIDSFKRKHNEKQSSILFNGYYIAYYYGTC